MQRKYGENHGAVVKLALCVLMQASSLCFQGYVDSTHLSSSISDVHKMDAGDRGSNVTSSTTVASSHRGYVLMANHNWISLFRERAYTR